MMFKDGRKHTSVCLFFFFFNEEIIFQERHQFVFMAHSEECYGIILSTREYVFECNRATFCKRYEQDTLSFYRLCHARF